MWLRVEVVELTAEHKDIVYIQMMGSFLKFIVNVILIRLHKMDVGVEVAVVVARQIIVLPVM
jgi:multisubunit Na+/H+ antiporter MnhB subunit